MLRFYPIHFTVTLTGLKNLFVISRTLLNPGFIVTTFSFILFLLGEGKLINMSGI